MPAGASLQTLPLVVPLLLVPEAVSVAVPELEVEALVATSWQVPRTQEPVQQSVSLPQVLPRPASAEVGTHMLQSEDTLQPAGQVRLPQMVVPVVPIDPPEPAALVPVLTGEQASAARTAEATRASEERTGRMG